MKSKAFVFGIFAAGLPLAGNFAARAETIFNPVNDWAWTFLGSSPSLPQQGFALLSTYCGYGACFTSAPKVICFTNGSTPPSSINVCKNPGPATASYQTIMQPPDLLRMDPEDGVVTARFTAPVNGVYQISGRYQMIDAVGNEVLVSIVTHGQSGETKFLPATPLSGYGNSVPFNFKVSLPAGGTLDFSVNTGGNYTFESTGLKVDVVGPL